MKTREIEDLKAQIILYQNASQLNVKSLKKNNPSVKSVQKEKTNKVRFVVNFFFEKQE